jgi:hypothetical protein
MSEFRWRVGRKLGRTLYRDDRCIGMVDTPELAAEIVAVMNSAAPNDREWIAAALTKEANRIFREQVQDYPSNTLDYVAWNLRMGATENLSKPDPYGPHSFRAPECTTERSGGYLSCNDPNCPRHGRADG